MPPANPTPDDLAALRLLAQQWGKIVSRHAFGEQGPGLDVTFAQMESLALAAAQGLTEGALVAFLELQAQKLADHQACPSCGTLCRLQRQPRPLMVRGGTEVPHSEPMAHCPQCRRDFFPSTAPVAAGQPRLQRRRAGKDRHRRRRA